MNTQYTHHYKALFTLGIPIVIGQIGVIILGFADTLMIGHHSTNELAAASFVNNMFTLAIIFATGFSYGLTPIVGSLFGRGETHIVGRMLKNSLFANTLLAILLTAIMGVLYLNIHRLGQPEELLPLMRPYFIVLLISLIFVLLFNGFKQFADGITDTRVSMWILLAGNVMNIIGNYILIYGKLGMPEMGLLGAGISTLASRIMMVIVFALIFFCTKRYHIYKEGFTRGATCRRILLFLSRAAAAEPTCCGWPSRALPNFRAATLTPGCCTSASICKNIWGTAWKPGRTTPCHPPAFLKIRGPYCRSTGCTTCPTHRWMPLWKPTGPA